MSWARYIQSKDKKVIEVNNIEYMFPQMKWVVLNNPALKRRILDHPDVFEVAEFDIGIIEGIPGIRCHGKMVYTDNPISIAILRSSPYFSLKYASDRQHIFRVSISDDRFRLINILKKSSGTVGVYRMKGGWGDVVMAFSAAKALKKQYPHLGVTYACPSNFKELVDGDPAVKWQHLNDFVKSKYDVYLNLTSPCIHYEIAKQPRVDKNRTEIFCKECAVNYKKYFKLSQVVNPTTLTWAKKQKFLSSESKNPIIGFVPSSCAPIRNWWGFGEVAKYCREKYASTNLIFNADPNYSWDGCAEDIKIFGYSMGQVVALLSLCDLVIGVDTGPMHSASALAVPTIWLFTHIDGKIRTKDYPKAHVIQNLDCVNAPCWYVKPCDDGKTSKCGLAIKPLDIISKIQQVMQWPPMPQTQI